MSHLIIVYFIDKIWPSESNDKNCYNHWEYHTEPNKFECQKLCEQKANCVGISYTNAETYGNLCHVCLDDNLMSDDFGFNFYRRPGIDSDALFEIQRFLITVFEHINYLIIMIYPFR